MDSFAKLSTMPAGINSYSDVGHARKQTLHSSGRAFLRRLAADLGLAPGSFDIRSNRAGIAVSGEVTLHAEWLYVQLGESCIGRGGVSVLYRSCKGRKDYSGGQNHWRTMAQMHADYPAFVAHCKSLQAQP